MVKKSAKRGAAKKTKKAAAKKVVAKKATKSRAPTRVARRASKKPAAKEPAAKKPAAKKRAPGASREGRLLVENVNVPGYRTSVDAAKYATTHDALMRVLPAKSPGLTQTEMGDAVAALLTGELKQKAMWWVKTVQLDQEAKGRIVREKTKPLRWHKA